MSALALAVGLLPTVLADEVTSTKPEITVVAKRITGEDNYMEISLEVNGDYEDYSSVGAVLQYDPSLIVPTTWDDEATAVDMSESTTWATRRALPTLGKDTWTTHTALTYIESKTDTATNQTTKTGYLYLGAEYSGVVPNNSTDPSATADPDATPTSTKTPTVTPTPDPKATPDPDQHQNPVVVARFTYADENAKKKIEDQWTSAWDSDWTQNKVLTIASDDVSSVSPAQFGFMIYKADFSMKGYQYDYTDSVLETSEQAANKDIEIVLGQGKSAKAGGLSLNDIYVTMFYDWDDSLIGTLTCGVGEDATESVNDYVKEKFIHPDLQTNTNYSSKERTDNYRGEYPHAGPNSTDPTTPGGTGTVTNGSDYPLTNKLEYCFAGKTIHADAPYAGGWTKVSASNMSDTWTALDNTTTFDLMPELGADGNPVDSSQTKPDMESFDFSDVTTDDIDGGTLVVKAVYTPGTNLDFNGDRYYSAIGPLQYALVTSNATSSTYSISFEYRRVNKLGYGVTRPRDLGVKMDITQVGASASTALAVTAKNQEIVPVVLTPTNAVSTVGYQLKDIYNSDVITGAYESEANAVDGKLIELQGAEGVIFKFTASTYLEQAYNDFVVTGSAVTNSNAWKVDVFNALKVKRTTAAGAISTAAQRKNATQAVVNCIKGAIADGKDYHDLTWYQIQYSIIYSSTPYVSADVAKAETEKYDALMNLIK